MRHVESIFPIPIAVVRGLTLDFDPILSSVEWMPLEPYSPGSATSTDYHVLNRQPETKRMLESELTMFAREVYAMPVDLRITTSWLTRTLPAGFSSGHNHHNSLLSGVWYPADGSPISFQNPSATLGGLMVEYDHLNDYNSGGYDIPVAANTLVLFPSRLTHRVLVNESDGPRYSLAFNSFPRGEFGLADSTLTWRD